MFSHPPTRMSTGKTYTDCKLQRVLRPVKALNKWSTHLAFAGPVDPYAGLACTARVRRAQPRGHQWARVVPITSQYAYMFGAKLTDSAVLSTKGLRAKTGWFGAFQPNTFMCGSTSIMSRAHERDWERMPPKD